MMMKCAKKSCWEHYLDNVIEEDQQCDVEHHSTDTINIRQDNREYREQWRRIDHNAVNPVIEKD